VKFAELTDRFKVPLGKRQFKRKGPGFADKKWKISLRRRKKKYDAVAGEKSTPGEGREA